MRTSNLNMWQNLLRFVINTEYVFTQGQIFVNNLAVRVIQIATLYILTTPQQRHALVEIIKLFQKLSASKLCVFCSAGLASVFLHQAEAPVALGSPYNHQQAYIGFTYAPAASELYTNICVLAIASLPWTIQIQLFYNYSGVTNSFTKVDN